MVDDNPDISSLIWLKESAEANGLQLIFDLVSFYFSKEIITVFFLKGSKSCV